MDMDRLNRWLIVTVLVLLIPNSSVQENITTINASDFEGLKQKYSVASSQSINPVHPNNSMEAPLTKSTQITNDTYLFRTPLTRKFVNKPEFFARKIDLPSTMLTTPDPGTWECPGVTPSKSFECGCDLPHTLRCSGDIHGMELLARGLRESKYSVSLLDCTLKNVSILSEARIFENISLHGLVISSGEIKRLHRLVFSSMKSPLYELGLPNNALTVVPASSLQPLNKLDRLDLSNNKIKMLSSTDFTSIADLTYLDISENQISSISPRTFTPLQKLTVLKMNGNRLGDVPSSLQAIGKCLNLRELDMRSNAIRGPLNSGLLPILKTLRSINLNKNKIGSVKAAAFQNFPNLVMLSMRQCQIDVLEDHCFSGMGALQELDLSYNGIVSISDGSLKHLPRLLVIDLRHNFLRAVTPEMLAPLTSIKELQLDGNDISIVQVDALRNVSSLKNLSLLNNPLACDCKLRPFAEWIHNSSVSKENLLGAVCATPPRLEGAPLLQIPVSSLTCDQLRAGQDTIETIEQQMNNTFVNDNQIFLVLKNQEASIELNKVRLSIDYGLLMTWTIAKPLMRHECNTLFIFEKFDTRSVLRNSSPISCEYDHLNNPNSFTILIPQGFDFTHGSLYKFCLTLTDKTGRNDEISFGCSSYVDLDSAKTQNDEGLQSTVMPSLDDGVGSNIPFTHLSTSTYSSISIPLHTMRESSTKMWLDTDITTQKRIFIALGSASLLASIGIFMLSLYRYHQKRQRPPSIICSGNESAEYVKLQATTAF